MQIQDRIIGLQRVRARDLLPHPLNWRTHPKAQREAMQAMLARIGFAGAALVRQTPNGLQLIDGHLRTEVAEDELIPVLVTDLSEEEALELLATYDPIGAMAVADQTVLADLFGRIDISDEPVRQMLAELEDGTVLAATQKKGATHTMRERGLYIKLVVPVEDLAPVETALEAAADSDNDRGKALLKICRAYTAGLTP